MSTFPPNSYNTKTPKQPTRVNPLSRFLTKEDINWNPQSYARIIGEIKLWSSGERGIEWAGVPVGGYENVDGRIKAVISDVVALPVWNIAHRENNLQILVEDFERIKKSKQAIGLIHSHPGNSELLPSLADWSLFLYLHACHQEDGLIFIICDGDAENFAIYNFPKEELGSKSFVELFRRESAEAQKRTRRGTGRKT